jgi:hypothetical protein
MRCSRGRGTGARRAPFGRPGGQPLHELQRTHHQVRGAIAPRGLELQLHLPGGVELHPLVRQCRPGDGAAQLFQPLAVMGLDSHRGVQAEAVDVGAQGLARRSLARHCTSQGQHLLPGAGPEGDAIRHSRRLQRSQRACLFAFGLRLGQPGLAHVFHQHAPAREQRHQPGDDGLRLARADERNTERDRDVRRRLIYNNMALDGAKEIILLVASGRLMGDPAI